MSNRKRDVFDYLGEEAVDAQFSLAWEFLEAHGYKIPSALRNEPTERRMQSFMQKMKKKREELRHFAFQDRENGCILFGYVLYRRGREVARSRAIKFMAMEKEEDDGEQGD
jgi:hypothetical protein